MNAQHHAARSLGGQCLKQPGQFTLAAGEADGIPRQGPGGRCRERSRCLSPRGRQHVLRRSLAPGRRDKQRAYRLGQIQRIGQQPRGVLMRGAADAPLQVTDRPRAQARRPGQLLLRQPGLRPQLPQQPGERKRRLLCHRRKPPRNSRPCPPGPAPAGTHLPSLRRPGHPGHPRLLGPAAPAAAAQPSLTLHAAIMRRWMTAISVGGSVGGPVWSIPGRPRRVEPAEVPALPSPSAVGIRQTTRQTWPGRQGDHDAPRIPPLPDADQGRRSIPAGPP
jgi:hypothetical protein